MNGSRRTVAVERTLTQQDFDAFAALSGDNNPIHVDPDFSARTAFGRTVSHGMLLYAILRGLADRTAPGSQQLSQSLMFPAPAFAGDRIRFEVTAEEPYDLPEQSLRMNAVRMSDGVCVCEGECVVRRPPGGAT
jgi:acyl dehydratase